MEKIICIKENSNNYEEELHKDVYFKEMEQYMKERLNNDDEVWAWPPYNEVKGFLGDGDIGDKIVIWITERPSDARNKMKKNNFPDRIDQSFYKILKEENFQNIHLTDFIKIKGKAGEKPDKYQIEVSAEWMRREIKRFVKPNKKLIIIANTRRVEDWMRKHLQEYSESIVYVSFFKNILSYISNNNYGITGEDIIRIIIKKIKN